VLEQAPSIAVAINSIAVAINASRNAPNVDLLDRDVFVIILSSYSGVSLVQLPGSRRDTGVNIGRGARRGYVRNGNRE
jgi:hypothetical protein